MRRSARGDKSSAFSLFPFLTVQLCTMGVMVVLLVAMAHVARDKAEAKAKQAQDSQIAATSPEAKLAQAKLAEAKTYEAKYARYREQVAERLQQEQQHLSDIEENIRRMQKEAESLQAEAMEIIALETTHVDDLEIAKRELERLNELVDIYTEENAELEQLTSERQRRYAIVQLREGENGTRRPAIYFECHANGVTLQPEGIEFPKEDFAPPAHVSSPLAAAIRAIKQHYLDHPETRAEGEQGAPYPLLVVRPGGVTAYHRVTQILESVDTEYGYQPVAQDWPLEYELPNPVMAEQISRAVELARDDRLRLADSAPQLFRQTLGGWGQSDHQLFEQASLGGSSPQSSNPFAGIEFSDQTNQESNGAGTYSSSGQANTASNSNRSESAYQELANHENTGGQAHNSQSSKAAEQATYGNGGTAGSHELSYEELSENNGSQPSDAENRSGVAGTQLAGVAAGSDEQNSDQQGGGSGGATSDEGSGAQADSSTEPQDASQQQASAQFQQTVGDTPANTTAANKQKNRDGIAMLRMVNLAVDADRVGLLSTNPKTGQLIANGASIDIAGNPSNWMPTLLQTLKQHADSWGIAGDGMYWKSSLVLQVIPGGEQRAEELTSYFKRSGIEVRQIELAQSQGGTHATRR